MAGSKKSVRKPTRVLPGPVRELPRCSYAGVGCGFVGEPNDQQSPYIACGGVPSAHYRPEVGRVRVVA